MYMHRAVDCQASDDPMHELGLTIHSSTMNRSTYTKLK